MSETTRAVENVRFACSVLDDALSKLTSALAVKSAVNRSDDLTRRGILAYLDMLLFKRNMVTSWRDDRLTWERVIELIDNKAVDAVPDAERSANDDRIVHETPSVDNVA